jgi:uncharacterized protein
MQNEARHLAVITGATTGIGLALARLCAEQGYDLIVIGDGPLREAMRSGQALGVHVEALITDLSSAEGVEAVYAAIGERNVELLAINPGLGNATPFFDQDVRNARRAIAADLAGTLSLVHQIGSDMRRTGHGRILITLPPEPGPPAAVGSGIRAFIDAFVRALRSELGAAGISITCLMPAEGRTADAQALAKAAFEAVMNQQGKAEPAHGTRRRATGPAQQLHGR